MILDAPSMFPRGRPSSHTITSPFLIKPFSGEMSPKNQELKHPKRPKGNQKNQVVKLWKKRD
jgi:hypothetical protein